MQVRVLYLGMLKEIAGCEQESLEVTEGASLGDLYRDLQERMPQLKNFEKAVALALNQEYSDGSATLRDNDEVALLPPVSGGAPDPVATSRRSLDDEESTARPSLPLSSEHASLVQAPIDAAAIAAAIRQPEDGARGWSSTVSCATRRAAAERSTWSTPPMSRWRCSRWKQLAEQALARFASPRRGLVHRLGRLQIGETSVYIVVAAAHRAAAFDACRWVIDTLKKTVPIWKKEFFEDGAVWADGEPFPPELPVGGGARQSKWGLC